MFSTATTSSTTARAEHHEAAGGVAELADRLGLGASTTVLAVWAHPDDESFCAGGLLAEAAARGGRVVTVTASLGEAGVTDPDRYPPDQLGSIRHRELTAALTALGADTDPVVLGYADGTLATVPVALAARRLATVIDTIEPDAVVTFGDDGVTGHPDHTAVAAWTRAALGDPTIPVLATSAGAVWPHDLVERMHTLGAFWPGHPHRHPAPGHVVQLGDAHLDAKLAALACHASQLGPLHDLLGDTGLARLAATEAYLPANPAAHTLLTGRPRAA